MFPNGAFIITSFFNKKLSSFGFQINEKDGYETLTMAIICILYKSYKSFEKIFYKIPSFLKIKILFNIQETIR